MGYVLELYIRSERTDGPRVGGVVYDLEKTIVHFGDKFLRYRGSKGPKFKDLESIRPSGKC